MFKKVAQYYREGKAAKAIKLLKKILLSDINEHKLGNQANATKSQKTPTKKTAKKKSPTPN